MKTMNLKRCIFALVVTAMATSISGCFKMGSLTSGSSSGSSAAAITVPTNSAEGPVAAVLKADQEFPSLKAMTGVTSPSNTTTATFNNIKSNLSIYGNPTTDVGQPFLQAHMTLAAEFCNDAITQNAKNIYPGISFTGAPSQFSGDTLTGVVNAMAANFWRRAPTSTEQSMISTAVASLITASTASTPAAQTTTVAIGLCTAMLGSTSAVAN